MKSTTIEIEGIGSVLLERSQRAKHLNISIKPCTGVRVAVPFGISFKRAEQIVYAKIAWIEKHLNKIKQMELDYKAKPNNSIEINRNKAKQLLTNRLQQLAIQYGFSYNRVSIRNQKTRWGSCSSQNNINLNIKLLKLTDELIDYVILHELVHTRIKNHSKKFWLELDKYVGDAKYIDSKLKNYKLGFL